MAVACPILAILGPTASGKTAVALAAARRAGAEILSADSMQVYRGMDVGTAKLAPDERRGLPHHLLDLLDVTETASVAEFQRLARAVIADCHARGVVPVLVGGSALYTRAVLDDFEFPGTDPELRTRLEEELAHAGAPALHERLADLDPDAAAGILPSNGRRIVRALEVLELTGGQFTATLPGHHYVYPAAVQVGVDIDRPALDRRIEQRVGLMWERGLVDEVRALEARGLRDGLTASRALGYQQVLAFLAGDLTQDEARDRTISATRRFARRQDSWFRKDDRVHWVRYDDPARVDRALEIVAVTPPG